MAVFFWSKIDGRAMLSTFLPSTRAIFHMQFIITHATATPSHPMRRPKDDLFARNSYELELYSYIDLELRLYGYPLTVRSDDPILIYDPNKAVKVFTKQITHARRVQVYDLLLIGYIDNGTIIVCANNDLPTQLRALDYCWREIGLFMMPELCNVELQCKRAMLWPYFQVHSLVLDTSKWQMDIIQVVPMHFLHVQHVMRTSRPQTFKTAGWTQRLIAEGPFDVQIRARTGDVLRLDGLEKVHSVQIYAGRATKFEIHASNWASQVPIVVFCTADCQVETTLAYTRDVTGVAELVFFSDPNLIS